MLVKAPSVLPTTSRRPPGAFRGSRHQRRRDAEQRAGDEREPAAAEETHERSPGFVAGARRAPLLLRTSLRFWTDAGGQLCRARRRFNRGRTGRLGRRRKDDRRRRRVVRELAPLREDHRDVVLAARVVRRRDQRRDDRGSGIAGVRPRDPVDLERGQHVAEAVRAQEDRRVLLRDRVNAISIKLAVVGLVRIRCRRRGRPRCGGRAASPRVSVDSPASSRSPTGEWSWVSLAMPCGVSLYRRLSPTWPIVSCRPSSTPASARRPCPARSGSPARLPQDVAGWRA